MAFDSRKYYDTVGVIGESDSDNLRFKETLPHLLEGVPLLDVGTGEGFFSEFLDDKFRAKVSSVDISEIRLREAIDKRRVSTSIIADATSLPFSNGAFGQVIANLVNYRNIARFSSIVNHLLDFREFR
ncbi:class I SAM-dependent methyltransferase [Candidatus Woesearchaeota archaeon]|nr:class I SAM-dependent methyltransferase [Candidatus Woesearchaeota archaeon]